MMKIEKIEIKGLFGKKDICWKLNPQVNVLVGVNGSGKSTILSILFIMMTDIERVSEYTKFVNISKIQFEEDYFFSSNFPKIKQKIIVADTQLEHYETNKNLAENLYDTVKKIIFSVNNNEADKKPILSKLEELQSNIDRLKNEINELKNINIRLKEWLDIQLELSNKLNVTMISTLNLSANAIFEFKGSNEEVLNILDLEMDKVLNQFIQKNDKQIQEKLMNSLNFFLNTVNKNAEHKNHSIVYFDTDIQKELKFSDLSSGERQLVYILVQVALNATEKEKSSIILMDEPEISLHLDWQEHFIKQLTVLNPDAQFIIVTHSPALIMNGWNDVYTDMEEITSWL